MVGLVMGFHGILYMLVKGIEFDPLDMVKYLPVSFFYILSMLIGYLGYATWNCPYPLSGSKLLRSATAIALIIMFPKEIGVLNTVGIILITGGVIGLSILEKKLQTEAMKTEKAKINPKYRIGVLAIIFPIMYAVLDAIGTAADGIYLDELELIGEDAALLAYEFTWLLYAVIAFIYLNAIKKQKFNVFKEPVRTSAAVFETAGQFFMFMPCRIKRLSRLPMIASYSIVSVILSRLFLKEKLSKIHYVLIIIVMAGIAVLGVAEEL